MTHIYPLIFYAFRVHVSCLWCLKYGYVYITHTYQPTSIYIYIHTCIYIYVHIHTKHNARTHAHRSSRRQEHSQAQATTTPQAPMWELPPHPQYQLPLHQQTITALVKTLLATTSPRHLVVQDVPLVLSKIGSRRITRPPRKLPNDDMRIFMHVFWRLAGGRMLEDACWRAHRGQGCRV